MTPARRVGLGEKLSIAGPNAVRILGHIAALDEFRLGLIALALLPLALVWARRDRERAFAYAAVLLAIGIFCGGYAFIQAENARYFWFVFFVLVAAAFHFVGLAPASLSRRESQRRLVAALLGTLAVVSFAFHPVRAVSDLLRRPPPGREHRLAAEWLAAKSVVGPLASLGERGWWDGLHTAYYLGAKYVGSPRADSPSAIAAEMRDAGATVLLLWDTPPRLGAFAAEPAFEVLGSVDLAGAGRRLTALRLRPGGEGAR